MSATPILTTFDAGELSPMMGGRVDFEKYPNGCSLLENFITTVQGPAVRRGGTTFVSEVADSGQRTWLKEFVVSDGTKYMLEFGNGIIRFYTDRGRLVSGGTQVAIASPYTAAYLTDSDGVFALRFAQSADTMYIFHPYYPPTKLLRTSATTFVLQQTNLSAGPLQDQNIDRSKIIQASDRSGAITLTANFDAFTAADVGTIVYLEVEDFSDIRPWAVHQYVSVGDYRRVDKRVYRCNAVGSQPTHAVTGDQTPTHTEGYAWDGDGVDADNDDYGSIGVEWQYINSGYSYAKITAITDARTASAYVTTGDSQDDTIIMPQQIVDQGTWKWRKALFNGIDGWPTNGAFWRNRLVLARGRWIAMSVSADYENFATQEADESTADSAIVQQLNSRRLNEVVWLSPSDNLLVGMNGDEWVIGPIQQSEAVSASNIQAVRRTSYGSRGIVPIEVGGALLFVQASGKKLRDYKYSYSSDNYVSTDTTKLADHITTGASGNGSGILSLAFQQEPFSIVWAARGDGTLLGMTYDQEEGRSDVIGWQRHPMTNGAVECVAVMPSPDGTYDDLWMIVRRVIGGATRRFVEYMRLPLQTGDAQANAFYVDCGLSYSGTAAATISGLSHLEGQEVAVLANGAATPNQTVSGGAITLDAAATVVHVGLPSTCRLRTMQLNVNTPTGTGQGKTKRLTKVTTRLLSSLGGRVGPNFTQMEDLNFRRPADQMDQAPPLFTGDKQSLWLVGYQDEAFICYENSQPLPVTLLAFMPELTVAT
ncbi:hypothetical protein [Chitinasiproducens palmae]|uniref:Phage protein n=1 Tax=Chitinasiproducens palmae TaxID=1770053 RepID=A0A1H2PQS9_9BURK|nr:hypothetical protein [Chitinasiproducens palmae]SDV49190.1 hypothetical protein SAMN05216551_107140 [Chitinasiproducens palmae]